MKPDLDAILASVQAREHTREVYRLTDALMRGLRIQPGYDLAPFLAPGNRVSNREAVAIWLEEQLHQPDMDLSRYCIELLLPKLRRTLQEIEETAEWL